jgi:hypothetical protein
MCIKCDRNNILRHLFENRHKGLFETCDEYVTKKLANEFGGDFPKATCDRLVGELAESVAGEAAEMLDQVALYMSLLGQYHLKHQDMERAGLYGALFQQVDPLYEEEKELRTKIVKNHQQKAAQGLGAALQRALGFLPVPTGEPTPE